MGVTETTRPASMVQFKVRWCPSTRHPHRAFGEGCPKMVMAYRSGPSRTPPPRSSCGSRRRMSAAVLAPESDNPQSRRASAAAKATAFSRRSASSRPSGPEERSSSPCGIHHQKISGRTNAAHLRVRPRMTPRAAASRPPRGSSPDSMVLHQHQRTKRAISLPHHKHHCT